MARGSRRNATLARVTNDRTHILRVGGIGCSEAGARCFGQSTSLRWGRLPRGWEVREIRLETAIMGSGELWIPATTGAKKLLPSLIRSQQLPSKQF